MALHLEDPTLRAEIDRLKERADVFNTFIRDLMERMEHAEKGLSALETPLQKLQKSGGGQEPDY